MRYKIIDFHTHAFPENVAEKAVKNLGDHYGIGMQGSGSIEDLLTSAREAHIEKVVVHATATRPGQVENVNNWMADTMKKYENVIGFGTIHPDYPDIRRELDRVKALGLKGIKLHPDFQAFDIDDPKMYTIYEEIGETLPILMHTGDENLQYSSPSKLSKVLQLFPRLRVVAAHLGGYSRWKEAREYLYGKNVFLDTSSSLWRLDAKEAVELIRAHGVDKVLFGTDYPITYHSDELGRFMNLALTEEEREKIFYKNAVEFLNIG